MMKQSFQINGITLIIAVLFVGMFSPFLTIPGQTQSRGDAAPVTFHHVHLNSTDPAAAISFCTSTFDMTRKASLAGWDGVQSENMIFSSTRQAGLRSPSLLAPSGILDGAARRWSRITGNIWRMGSLSKRR
ncbi:MAG: hypothetical protein IPJ07_09065 [Acidobacteria bacterium]|nr:hypothetical protein [Acidobacteriota bacterium]